MGLLLLIFMILVRVTLKPNERAVQATVPYRSCTKSKQMNIQKKIEWMDEEQMSEFTMCAQRAHTHKHKHIET